MISRYQVNFSWTVEVLLLVLCVCSGGENSLVTSGHTHAQSCPDTWFVPTGENKTCKCGQTIDGIVSCDEITKEVGVLDCYCITSDSTSNTTVVGQCLFNCVNVTKSYLDNIFHHVPPSIANGDVNNSVCGYLNRCGTLCSQCIANHNVLARSYDLKCRNCNDTVWRSWPVYLAVTYVPLTVFMILILLFRVSVVSPKLHVAISMLQAIAIPFNIHSITEGARHNAFTNIVSIIMFTLYGMWNLDFFYLVLPGVCLDLTTLQVLILEYAVAVYPMVVTVMAFTILELHNRGYRPVMCMYRPFHYFFAQFRRKCNVHTSLIDSFITFFILSTTKLIHVSFSLLFWVTLYAPDGKITGHYLYKDASIQYFGRVHCLYAILAIAVICLLLFLPLCLLFFYQFTFCQRCLVQFKLKFYLLDRLMHNFNRYYKDGSDGSLDCRWFAALYVSVKIGIYLPLLIVISAIFYNLLVIYFLLCALVVVIVQPYREEYQLYNILDPAMILMHALFIGGINAINVANVGQRRYIPALFVFVGLVGMLPLLYLASVTFCWVYHTGFRHFFKRPSTHELSVSVPDRILHSGNYANSLN